MTDKVWVAIEKSYDYRTFQRFLGVSKTKEGAGKIANISTSVYEDTLVYGDYDENHFAKEDKGHIHIFEVSLSEGVDK